MLNLRKKRIKEKKRRISNIIYFIFFCFKQNFAIFWSISNFIILLLIIKYYFSFTKLFKKISSKKTKALVNNKSLNNNIELLRISNNFKYIRWIKYRDCLTLQMYIIIERNKFTSFTLQKKRNVKSKISYC